MAGLAPAAEQLHALQREHEKLQQALAARDRENGALREIAEAAGQLGSQDAQAAKVIEISKKNRTLNLLLERERQRVAQLQQSLAEAAAAQGGALGAIRSGAAASAGAVDAAADASAREAAAWRERAQQQTNKLSQLEQRAFALEADNKRLTRALAREVGDDVPLAKVLDEGSDWKGRRETIVALRDTIRKLKEQQAREAHGLQGTPPPSKHDEAHRNVIGKLAKERAAEADRLAAELTAAKAAAEQLRVQYGGASSRRKVLEEELASLREKMAVVLRKTQNDDRLLAALRAELAAAVQAGGGEGGGVGGRRMHAALTGVDESSADCQAGAWIEVTQLRQQVLEQEEQLEQGAKVIRYLQAQLGQQPGAGIGAGAGSSTAAGSPGCGDGGTAKERLLLEQLEASQDECSELRGQVAALQDDVAQLAAQRPGTSGMSGELLRQVQELQKANERLRGQVTSLRHERPLGGSGNARQRSSRGGIIGASGEDCVGTGPGTERLVLGGGGGGAVGAATGTWS